MINELIFLFHVIIVSLSAIAALYFGKEALVGIIGLLAVLANLFVVKQITLFGFNVTCGDVYIVGAVFALSLLQEYFGKKIALKAVWISFFMAALYVVMSQLQILYVPNVFDAMHQHFVPILTYMPRILMASIVALLVGQYSLLGTNIVLKIVLKSSFIVRNTIALICSQALDTVVFGFLGLYGIVNSVPQVILFSFIIKVVVIVFTTPFVALSKRFIKA